jgi:hypothetical protein
MLGLAAIFIIIAFIDFIVEWFGKFVINTVLDSGNKERKKL